MTFVISKNPILWGTKCFNSPYLAPIENSWLLPRAVLRKVPYQDKSTTKELIFEGWESVSQEFINMAVNSMPKRYQAVLDGGVKMTSC